MPGLSVAGARAGLAGERSGLFMEQIRIIREMRDADKRLGRTGVAVRPRFGVWENVPGAFSSGRPKGTDFQAVVEAFVRIEEPYADVIRPASGRWENMLGSYWEYDPVWLGPPGTLKTSECPKDAAESFLSLILLDTVSFRYYLTRRACLGILRRSKERGKPLPPELKTALLLQAGLISINGHVLHPMAFTVNQRDEARTLRDIAGDSGAQSGVRPETFMTAGFCAGTGASAGSLGYQEECAPTLKATQSGSMMPAVLCLNDQGGGIMDWSEDMTGTLRAQEHGHQPLVFENHGVDARYTGPHPVSPTLSARAGTGGNNLPLALQTEETFCFTGNAIDRQPQNGGNGIGIQPDIAYTLTATDHHAVFGRQSVDVFRKDEVASTQSTRQYKDATDLICQPGDRPAVLIRRLVPTECERLQGFPDGWTALPGASDSARYKALGNSVAIPCVEYLMQGIALVLRGGL